MDQDEFERLIMEDDDGSHTAAILASGRPIYIAYDHTPAGHVVKVHPDGREELMRVDRAEAAKVLGD